MVATQDEEVFGILDFICKQKADRLEGLLASVYIVAKEEVVGLRRKATILEQTEKIIVLAMDITANLLGETPHVS